MRNLMQGSALHNQTCIRQCSGRTTCIISAGHLQEVWLCAQSGELFDYIVEKGRLLEDEARHFFQQVPLFALTGFCQTLKSAYALICGSVASAAFRHLPADAWAPLPCCSVRLYQSHCLADAGKTACCSYVTAVRGVLR